MKVTDLTNFTNKTFPIECRFYKDICELFNEKSISNNDKKKAQIARWERFIVIERIGQRWRILSLKTPPDPEPEAIENRGNEQYQVDGIKLLLNHIASNYRDAFSLDEHVTFCLNRSQGYNIIGLCNFNYVRKFVPFLSEEESKVVSENQNAFFRKNVRGKMKQVLDRIINKGIKDGYFIKIEEIYYVVKKHIGKVPVKATDEELVFIEEAERIVLSAFGVESINQLGCQKDRRQYFDELNKILKTKYNIDYSLKNIHITINLEKFKPAELLIDEHEIPVLLYRNNQKFLKSLRKSMEKSIEKNRATISNNKKPIESESKSKFTIDISNISDKYIYPEDHMDKWNWWLKNYIDKTDEIEEPKNDLLNELLEATET